MRLVNRLERMLTEFTISEFLKAGYALGVNDGDEVTIANSTDAEAIQATMHSVDEEHLEVYQNGKRIGWVFFVYGNSGYDAINDHTTNLRDTMKAVDEYANHLEAEYT